MWLHNDKSTASLYFGRFNPSWMPSLSAAQILRWKKKASVAASSRKLEQEAEQVDNVQVEAEGGKNIFLWTYSVTLVS